MQPTVSIESFHKVTINLSHTKPQLVEVWRNKEMRVLTLVTLAAVGFVAPNSMAEVPLTSSEVKNQLDDHVYVNEGETFYCGCPFRSDMDDDGSGDILLNQCKGFLQPPKHISRASRVEWEHVVPASLTPAHEMKCWRTGRRKECETNSPQAAEILFDLHNLVPSVGQVNAYRSNLRYKELENSDYSFGDCKVKVTNQGFEPPNHRKGDVARIWLYMNLRHGVKFLEGEKEMFERWSANDPVSSEELERDERIRKLLGHGNPFVR